MHAFKRQRRDASPRVSSSSTSSSASSVLVHRYTFDAETVHDHPQHTTHHHSSSRLPCLSLMCDDHSHHPSELRKCPANTSSSQVRFQSEDATLVHPLRAASMNRFSERSDSTGSFESAYTDHDATGSPSDGMGRTMAKSSRYLREIDRRTILQRIENGERQASLAKEYHVSRAAICNLNKHRDVVMSRTDENPLAKHPKKPRAKELVPKMKISSKPNELLNNGAMVYEIRSRVVALFLTKLRDVETSTAEFGRYGSRLMRLMVDEALALVPLKTVQVFFNTEAKIDGVEVEYPPCAVAIDGGEVLMDVFHLLEPESPIGWISSSPSSDDPSEMVLDVPHDLDQHSVFLFDLVTYSVDSLCDAVDQLVARGASEDRIWQMALGVSYYVIEQIHTRLPCLKVVTAVVDRTSMNQKPFRPDANTAPPVLKPDVRLEILANRFLDVFGGRKAQVETRNID